MAWDVGFRLPQTGFFTPDQLAGLRALFRAIQPTDVDRGIPGADDSGAADFLDRLLARVHESDGIHIHTDLPKWADRYPGWLAQFDRIARTSFGAPLADLTTAQATEIVAALEAGQLAGFEGDQRGAFVTIWRHCLQGCWSDPRWGGNRDRIMWRWLGHLYDPQDVAVGQAGGGHAGH